MGSLICFVKGEKSPADYRHYRLREEEGPDDYAMMAAVLRRRFGKERPPPDLLLIDGGKGQLNVARKVLEEYNLSSSMDLASLAKEHKDEGEKLFLPGEKEPLLLPRHNPVLLFCMRVRDESHRFGITFHRHLRRKKTLSSSLNKLEGIGPKRRQMLLKHFGSLKRIRAATEEELRGVSGLGSNLAASIFKQLQGEKRDGR